MTTVYSEIFTVDLEHADVAYKLFDYWKAQGKTPEIKTSTRVVTISYSTINVTKDKESDNELPYHE